jgi:hypothetical protein
VKHDLVASRWRFNTYASDSLGAIRCVLASEVRIQRAWRRHRCREHVRRVDSMWITRRGVAESRRCTRVRVHANMSRESVCRENAVRTDTFETPYSPRAFDAPELVLAVREKSRLCAIAEVSSCHAASRLLLHACRCVAESSQRETSRQDEPVQESVAKAMTRVISIRHSGGVSVASVLESLGRTSKDDHVEHCSG